MTDRRVAFVCAILAAMTAQGLAARGAFDPPAPQRLKLGDAEIGFCAHFGVSRVAGMDVTQKEMLSFGVKTNDSGAVEAVWRGHAVLGPDFFVRAEFSRCGEGWDYSMETGQASGPMGLEWIEFPSVKVPHSPSASVVFSGPMSMGYRQWPDWRRHPLEAPVVLATPKAFQFVAIADGDASWYLDARDADCHHKQVVVRKEDPLGKTATLSYRWYLPEDGRAVARMPWRGIFTRYSGDWFAAAEIYRRWARTTPRYRRAVSRNPGRLRDIALWAWNRGAIENVVPPVERFAKDAGVPVALDWYWWHAIPYDTAYPSFWPPREGASAFAAAIRRLKERGIYTMVYVNGLSWDRDDPTWAHGGERGVVMDRDRSYSGIPYNCFNGHRLARMCCEAQEFQDRLSAVVRHLAESGLDAVYLDQISCTSVRTCWNPHHRHVTGGGNYFSHGYRSFVERLAKENPTLQFSSEEASEDFIDSFDSFISVVGPSYERCGHGRLPEMELLPVWNAIYHGAVTCFGNYTLLDGIAPYDEKWPKEGRWRAADEKDWISLYPDQFAIEFCRGVAWGSQPSIHNFLLKFAEETRYAADYRLMVETARFYHANRDFLYDGELCDPGRLKCPKADVTFMRRATYAKSGSYEEIREKGLPCVFHGIWKAKDGRVRAILVNWSRSDAPYEIECPLGVCTGVLSPRSWAISKLTPAGMLGENPR